MQSKRDLKKQIRYICGDLVGECLLIGEVCPPDKQEALDRLIIDLAVLQESTIAKTNFCFDRSARDFDSPAAYRHARSRYFRAAFSQLHRRFNDSVRECVHRMNEIAGLAKA